MNSSVVAPPALDDVIIVHVRRIVFVSLRRCSQENRHKDIFCIVPKGERLCQLPIWGGKHLRHEICGKLSSMIAMFSIVVKYTRRDDYSIAPEERDHTHGRHESAWFRFDGQ